MIVPFHKPFLVGNEESYISKVIKNEHFSGDGPFSEYSTAELKNIIKSNYVHLTPSCTASLELVALSEDFEKGDEVIMPSYTFVSTANAFLLRGVKIKFVDVEPDTMNINASLIENAITSKTKAIVVVHYGGVSCDMDSISHICKKNNIILIEDAAQCINSYYKGKHLGTIGDYGCFSFHSQKLKTQLEQVKEQNNTLSGLDTTKKPLEKILYEINEGNWVIPDFGIEISLKRCGSFPLP